MDQESGGSRNGTTARCVSSINPCSPRRRSPVRHSRRRGRSRRLSRAHRARSNRRCRIDEQAATRPATRRCGKEHQMRRGFALLGLLVAVAIAAIAAMLTGQGPSSARASSHSEAPLISQDPRADNTDLYAFVRPERHEQGRRSSPTTSRSKLRPAGRTSRASTTPFSTRSRSTTTETARTTSATSSSSRPRRGTRTRSSTTPGRSRR